MFERYEYRDLIQENLVYINNNSLEDLINIDNKNKKVIISCDYYLVSRLFKGDVVKWFGDTKIIVMDISKYNHVKELQNALNSDEYRVFVIEGLSTYIGELEIKRICIKNKKFIISYRLKCKYGNIKDTLELMVIRNINGDKFNYEERTLKELDIQEIILNIVKDTVGDSQIGLTEQRDSYIRKYVSKILRVNNVEKLSPYELTKRFISKNRDFEPDYNTNIFNDTRKAYKKYIDEFTPNINSLAGVGLFSVFIYIQLQPKYKSFYKYVEDFYKAIDLKDRLGIYIKENYLEYDENNILRNIKFEEDCFERLSCLYRINLISYIVKEQKIGLNSLNYSYLACLLRIRDLEYSEFLISHYILVGVNECKDFDISLLYLKEAILYDDIIINVIETIMEVIDDLDINIVDELEYININTYNLYTDIDSDIYVNTIKSLKTMSNLRDNYGKFSIDLFDSDIMSKEFILRKFIDEIGNINIS